MKPTYEQLEQQLAAVVAENAGLKESRKNLVEFIHEELNSEYPLNMDIKTPATDAYLAEVRAQTRNELIAELEARFTELSLSETLSPELKSGAAGAVGLVSTFRSEPDNEFAAQLRQGAEHE